MMRKSLIFTFALALAVPFPAVAKQAAPDASIQHERFIPVEGGRNFRDVGGYRTADGRTVRWGRLYRAGSLGNLTVNGMTTVRGLGIRSIVDLRMTEERQRDMSNWLPRSGMGYYTRDYSLGGNASALAGGRPDTSAITADGIGALMLSGYRTMPKELAPQYRELFARLIAPGKGAVVVNCTAGKDRTGIASALVLTALGVPYATVRQDFLLSNDAPGMNSLQASLSPQFAALPKDVVRRMIGVDGEWLDAAFAQIMQDYGSVDAFLQKELGVGPREKAALRRRLLQ